MEKVFSSRYSFEAGDIHTTQVVGSLTCDNKTSIFFDILALRTIKNHANLEGNTTIDAIKKLRTGPEFRFCYSVSQFLAESMSSKYLRG